MQTDVRVNTLLFHSHNNTSMKLHRFVVHTHARAQTQTQAEKGGET